MDHLIPAATDLGLDTCSIGAFDPMVTRTVLGLPDSVEPIAFTPLGYPNDDPRPKKRKPLAELISKRGLEGSNLPAPRYPVLVFHPFIKDCYLFPGYLPGETG